MVAEHGQVVYEESSGFADTPGSSPCGPHLRFQASSISKQVVSVVALALQQRKHLHVDQPISQWLPDLPEGFEKVTLHHLLSQTSGIGHWTDLPGIKWSGQAQLISPPAPDALRTLTADAGLLSPAGTAWRYSGPGFFLAAQVLMAATGQRYRDLASDLVFEPAQMTSTTSGDFPLGRVDAAAGHRAGHRVHVDGGWAQITGSGDLWTTAGDLLCYCHALRSGHLLDLTTAALLWTPHVSLPAQPTVNPALHRAAAYGYGTFIGHLRDRPAWFVPGDNPGYQSLLAHPLDSDTDLVVLSNDETPGLDAAVRRAPLC